MNDTFEDRLLAELKAEITARAAQGSVPAARRMPGRRFLAGSAVVAAAAATAVAVPLVLGSPPPAYALTRNADGSITLQIREFRDPDQVERDLARMGVRADITYLPLGKQCGNLRAPILAGDRYTVTQEELTSKDPAIRAKVRRMLESTPSFKAVRPKNGVTIYPRHIKPGQIVLIVIMENAKQPNREHPGVAWQYSGRLTDGPVKPCEIVDDPTAFEVGTGTPPAGS